MSFKLFIGFNAIVAIVLIIISELPGVTTALAQSSWTVQDFFITTYIITFLLSLMITVLDGR